jgi:hypothetical protein
VSDLQLPIDFLTIKTPSPFQIDNEHSFKLGCNYIDENEFWQQAYFRGNEDTTICISIENTLIDYKSFVNSKEVEEKFISCLEYKGGITSSGTHLFLRDYIVTSDFFKVTTVSKFDSSQATSMPHYRKSILIHSSYHIISVIFNIKIDEKVPFDLAVAYLNEYDVIYEPKQSH